VRICGSTTNAVDKDTNAQSKVRRGEIPICWYVFWKRVFCLKGFNYSFPPPDEMSRETHTTAPQLLFDDGSRIIEDKADELPPNPRGITALNEYYEIDRLSKEIVESGFSRVALQFPDELLVDAADVCWMFEDNLPDAMVFILGDTTYAPCCPDQVAAAHLQADCLVHFGHACLSPCHSLPVLYSFGRKDLDTELVAQALVDEGISRLVVLYELQFSSCIDSLQDQLHALFKGEVEIGRVQTSAQPHENHRRECCHTSASESSACWAEKTLTLTSLDHKGDVVVDSEVKSIGGLQLPREYDFSDSTVLYIGAETTRQYMNVALRFISGETNTQLLRWDVENGRLEREISSDFQRKLTRRFYLVQKAKNCSNFGILVANLSDDRMRSVVRSLRVLLEEIGRTSYTFAVGKINPAKLANFAEIDCFVLVACPEHSLLDNDREFHTPVITPLELSMALDVVPWGGTPYSLHMVDFLNQERSELALGSGGDAESNDEDAPYYSLVTGQYERAPARQDKREDLLILPGQGQLMEYKSAAADFFKNREYQGLEIHGDSEPHAAKEGQTGIAAKYGDR